MTAPNLLASNDFISRQTKLLDVLSVVETSLSRTSNDESIEVNDSQTRKDKLKRTKRFRGKESIFKVPMDPPRRVDRLRQCPSKGKRWIKYSLSDVSDYALSNAGNTSAAFSFLKSMKERKEILERVKKEEEAEEKQSNANCKHLFKVPFDKQMKMDNPIQSEEMSPAAKAVFKSNKLVMPEYVVGQSKKEKKSVQKNVASEKAKEVYLDHIHAYEDE